MVVTLSTEIEALIKQKVESGRYGSASEVIQEAVLQLDDRQRDLDRLRAEVAMGFSQLDRGEGVILTPELVDELKLKAAESARLRRPIKDAVKP